MKKIFTVLMALMLLAFTFTFTQCKPDGGNERKIKVRCDMPMNNGATATRSDFCNLLVDDSIFWSTGIERLYLAIPGSNFQMVELIANNTEPQANVLEFEGEVDENLLVDGKEYEVWYFGNSKNLATPYMTENKDGGVIKSISGSIKTQSGKQEDLGYCHFAKTKVKAKYEGAEVVLPLKGILDNEMAIAYLELDGVSTLKGEAIIGTEYNFQYNGSNYELVVTEDANAKINVTDGEAKSFIAFFPNDKSGARLECSKGFYEFKKGVEADKFYYRFISDKEKAPLRWEEMEIEEQDHEWVDLDLPSGDLWAIYNIGATNPGEYGEYYAWGEIETKFEYTNATSLWYGKDLADFQANPTYDVAAAKWGGEWRMPNYDDFVELNTYCTWVWTTQNGSEGFLLTSKRNGETLFFPAGGYRAGTTTFGVGSDGCYFATTPYTSGRENAWMLWFNQVSRPVDGCSRAYGGTIRPVRPKLSDGGNSGGDVTNATVPTVTTNDASNMAATTATCGGKVTSDGGATVTSRGVYYGTSPNPETTGSRKASGSGTGSFTCNLTGLAPNTTYYVKAYATNSVGTSYGEQKTFKTTAATAPVVTTNAVSDIQATSATCGGNVTSDGGATVTARGVCWSTSQNPTISNSKTTDGSGTGSFTSTISGLSKNTTYYVRAYATNSIGTSYGEQRSFTTVGSDAKTIVFAEGVTMTSGWYDVNKLTRGGYDIQMCWAASSSNIIQWWQDRYVAAGKSLPSTAVTGPGTKTYTEGYKYNLALMELYRDLWNNTKGGEVRQGMTWYFEGRNVLESMSVDYNAQPLSSTSGGYYSSVWNQILPYVYHEYTYLGYNNLIVGEYLSYSSWSSVAEFSNLIVESMERGMASLVVSTGVMGGNLHAITLWGYEIDNSTNQITRIWVTDSDDLHQSGSGDPTQQKLNEYAVSGCYTTNGSNRIILDGAPYGNLFITGVYPVSGYGSN